MDVTINTGMTFGTLLAAFAAGYLMGAAVTMAVWWVNDLLMRYTKGHRNG
jgi:hypothetical protein